MRRHDKEIKDVAVIEAVLNKAAICHLSLARDNQPYVVPVNFGYREYSLYFHSAREGKKIKMIRENSNVCFAAETDIELVTGEKACDWGARYYSVIGFGSAYLMDSREEKTRALDIIMEKYAGTGIYEYSHDLVENMAVIRIDITDMSGKVSGYKDHTALLKK
ncbi:MAG: pyridoxamine 5'-phosphate oxidase family protein [Spirochaetae bacterium HGW-Spirochaetae-1]|jgi:hypothetical protein|nr:MAG: pyridoxamine 5'-phosphate oxidase family protein [Spirochaetae bacterium HGW-Spirochaetae-1]